MDENVEINGTRSLEVAAQLQSWPIARPFTISRGTKRTAEVVVATVTDGEFRGRGECVPYSRYGETAPDIVRRIDEFRGPFDRAGLANALPAGAARNALDCALWDLAAKRSGRSAWELADVPRPVDVVTAFTLSLDSPKAMGEQARAARDRVVLKVKLGTDSVALDIERLRAVRTNAPDARLIVDVNEGWSLKALEAFVPVALESGVEMIEQPLAEGEDAVLAGFQSPVPLCADESIRDGSNLAAVAQRYQAVNIKLDKTGGLTRALALAREARSRDLSVVVGCMVSTSLSMAPALLLAGFARFVDLDGPQLLDRDRDPGLEYNGSRVSFSERVWG